MWISDVIHIIVVNSLQERRILLVVAHVHKTVSPVLFIKKALRTGCLLDSSARELPFIK
jgi:hypothetical protein